jgi:ribosomal protein S18 acetylase RimI-like enzyme
MDDALTFRPAEPGDVVPAVPLIHSSGPAMFDWIFNRAAKTSQDFLTFAFPRGKSEFGFQNHTVAVLHDAVIGTIAFFTHADTKRFTRAALIEIPKFYGPFAAISVMRRGLKTETALSPPKNGQLYIAHVGVAEKLRGKGIGTAMMRYALEHNGKDPNLIPTLDVADTNPGAQRLYERLGFKVSAHLAPIDPSVPGHYFMERVP